MAAASSEAWGRAVCFAFALGLGWCVALGVRAEPPRVYVTARASDPALELDARQIAALARAALAESQGFRWQAADAQVRGEEREARAAHERAATGLRRGRQAYLRFELEQAVRLLESALPDWRRALAVLDSPEPVAETLMYLGACHVLAGDLTRASQVFAEYHVKFGDLSPNAGVFNPEILRQWDLAGHEQASEPGGALEVRVLPSNAEISVDGRVRGTGSQIIEGLAAGEHWVRVAVVGGSAFVGSVRVEPGLAAVMDAGTLSDSAQLLDLLEHAHTQEGARVLSEQLALDALGVIEVRRGATDGELDLALHDFQGETGREVQLFTKQVGPDFSERIAGARSLIAAWLDRVVLDTQSTSSLNDHEARSEGRGSEAKPVWYRRWWVWAIAGGAVAAGAVTTAVLVHGSSNAPPPKPQNTGSLVLQF